jgi:hypothetical protein
MVIAIDDPQVGVMIADGRIVEVNKPPH